MVKAMELLSAKYEKKIEHLQAVTSKRGYVYGQCVLNRFYYFLGGFMCELEGLKHDLSEMSKELNNIAEMLKSKKLTDDDYMAIRNQLTEKTALIQSLQCEATFRLYDDIAELLGPVEEKLQEVLEIARTRQTINSLNIIVH